MINKDQKKIIKHLLVLFGIITILGLSSYFLNGGESRLAVWDGEGTDALASNPINWDTDTAPVVDDDILFDGLNVSGDDPCTWDLSNDSFYSFTIRTGYSGIVTQSVDIYIGAGGYSQAAGTFTGETTKKVYLFGPLVKTGGTITSGKTNIVIGTGATTYSCDGRLYSLTVAADISLNANALCNSLVVNHGCTLSLGVHKISVWWWVGGYSNSGVISGTGTLYFMTDNKVAALSLGVVNCNVNLEATAYYGGHSIITLPEAWTISGTLTVTGTAPTQTLNLNGYDLTCTNLIIGIRGILKCSNSTINLNSLDSYNGTILEENGTWIFSDNGTVNAIVNEQFYNMYIDLPITIVNRMNITHELRLYSIESEYYEGIDVYRGVNYLYTIIPTDGNYSYGARITTTGIYSYLPTIIINLSDWYQDTNGTWYAYISCSLPVTYNITGEIAPFAIYNSGKIIITPPSVGNYSYIITGAHSTGSVGIVTGYAIIGMVTDVSDYDMNSFIWGLLLWIIITFFMIFGLIRDIPLVMICTWCLSLGNIVLSLTIDNFGPFVVIFALANTVIFAVGMIRWRI